MRMLPFASIGLSVALALVPGHTGAEDAPRTWTVSPGQTIQEAIDKAGPGDTVQILPGEYVQQITITKDNITIRGLEYEGERTTLAAKANEEDEALDAAITIGGNNVTVEGLVINGFDLFGIGADNCTGVVVRSVSVLGTGQSGVHFDDVREGVVDRVVAGRTGVGIAIQDSTACRITDSEAFSSRVGLYLGDSQHVTVDNSSFHHNATGAFLAGTRADDGRLAYVKLLRCRLIGNNADIGGPEEFPLHDAPSGVGIIVRGVSDVEIAFGVISENGSMGVVAMSQDDDEVRHAADEVDEKLPTERIYLHHNVYAANGDAPSEKFSTQFEGVPPGDLYWDGRGERNQFQENSGLKTYPEKLVVERGGVHTDVIHFQ